MRLDGLARKIRKVMSVPADRPELVQAQYRALSQQIPLLYFILMTSSWTLAAVFIDRAPDWLVSSGPMLLTFICGTRLIFWHRILASEPSTAAALSALRQTNRLAVGLVICCAIWVALLFPHGGVHEQGQALLYMGVTTVSAAFTLMHLRPAVAKVTALVSLLFGSFLFLVGGPANVANAISLMLAFAAMLIILQCHGHDMTQLVEAKLQAKTLGEQNAQLANFDSLTMLPNRRRFFNDLDQEWQNAVGRNGRLAVGVIGLDSFKPINDLYGHSIGDRTLVVAGERLRATLGVRGKIARLGGDEFALALPDPGSDAELRKLGEQICAVLREPIEIGDATVLAAASIGFATMPDQAATKEELFERADYALYRGKRLARGSVNLFQTEDLARIHRDAEIHRALQVADLDRELQVWFQPMVEIGTGRTLAFEALGRWNSSRLGPIPPTEFIRVAERSGQVREVTRTLLGKALSAAVTWPEPIRLSFNLSVQDLSSVESGAVLMELVAKHGFDPRRLDFEITETAMFQSIESVVATASQLREHGFGISLDDFGTGFSSLTHLHALPLNKIKVDRSFVTDVHLRPASSKIVKSLLVLSRDMGLGCVIEGVETAEELQALRGLGGQLVQGYFYSRPLPAEDIPAFLAQLPERRRYAARWQEGPTSTAQAAAPADTLANAATD